jgi:hypothetical protein
VTTDGPPSRPAASGRSASGPAVGRAEALRRVEEEIRRAQAEALGRTGERLATLLRRLAEADLGLDRVLAGLDPRGLLPPHVMSQLDERNRLWQRAEEVKAHLLIQREALGLRRHGTVEERYPVPPRRRAPARVPTG